MSEVLFKGDFSKLSAEEIKVCLEGVKSIQCDEITILEALISTSLASSKREAREFLKNGAVSVNGVKIADENYILNKNNAIDNVYNVIRRGKKLYALVQH